MGEPADELPVLAACHHSAGHVDRLIRSAPCLVRDIQGRATHAALDGTAMRPRARKRLAARSEPAGVDSHLEGRVRLPDSAKGTAFGIRDAVGNASVEAAPFTATECSYTVTSSEESERGTP
jgi:hypothetical protein